MSESVSVVIPAYKSHKTIKRALCSVVAQTYAPKEIIIVDDASGSDYLERLKNEIASIELNDIKVRVEACAVNKGPASARNRGWDLARGEFVAFLDSDDIWHPRKLEKQITLMLSTRSLFSAHEYVSNSEMNCISDYVSWYDFKKFLFKNRCSTPTVMVCRNISYRFEEGRRYSEDYQLWLRLAHEAPMPKLNAELARGFKRPWGDSGLSGNLNGMLFGQYKTYISVVRQGLAPKILLPFLLAWSTVRYLRRAFLMFLLR